MSKLTPTQALQAVQDGKTVEIYRNEYDGWQRFYPHHYYCSIFFDDGVKFRLGQEMITVGNVSFPKPYMGEMEDWRTYYEVSLGKHGFRNDVWRDRDYDKWTQRRGLVHLTKENAIAHAKALIELSGGKL